MTMRSLCSAGRLSGQPAFRIACRLWFGMLALPRAGVIWPMVRALSSIWRVPALQVRAFSPAAGLTSNAASYARVA
jgi:hypothetical protein